MQLKRQKDSRTSWEQEGTHQPTEPEEGTAKTYREEFRTHNEEGAH